MRHLFILLFSIMFLASVGQNMVLQGDVFNDNATPLGFATVALLKPVDSTLAFFAITNASGHFEIKNVKQNDYLLQVSYIGCEMYYRQIKVPVNAGNDLGLIVVKTTPINLKEVQITGEHVPLWLKGDTLEYNVSAFKTKPDAVAEDLLRKLPGVEVDRAGNIKAMGEDVRKVMVDGKEFFGNDPKVATKNVPVDAIKRVQVYDKKSDESEFTGINDGSRDKTVNLVLKDDKKNGTFGDISGGAGTGDHYKAGAKAFRFSAKNQMAGLGMLNNINQFGFSFDDYLNFGGGLGGISMGHGGSAKIELNSDNSFPVNFGQPVTGLLTSGAAGFNYSHQSNKNNRFNISYIGNGSNKSLLETEKTKNFLPAGTYNQLGNSNSSTIDRTHQVNFGWKNQVDSTMNIILSGAVTLGTGSSDGSNLFESAKGDSLVNRLSDSVFEDSWRINSDAGVSLIKKLNKNRTILKLGGSGSFSYDLSNGNRQNYTTYFDPENTIGGKQKTKYVNDKLRWSAVASVTQKLKGAWYIRPEVRIEKITETLTRTIGFSSLSSEINDSLSPDFMQTSGWLKPALELKRATDKTQFSIQLKADIFSMSNTLNNESKVYKNEIFFTPEINWEKELRVGRRLSAGYSASVNAPSARQLLPVPDILNPLSVYIGNRSLKPEYSHDVDFSWMLFDQFSFTSLFTRVYGKYTLDKINWSRTVNDSLGQVNELINVADDYNAGASIDFSTPVRKLGLTIHTSLRENWNRGLSLINGTKNINTNFEHKATLSFDNRKKEKWDLNAGATLKLTKAVYSLDTALNNRYFDISYFAETGYTPNKTWNFRASAEVTNYNEKSFGSSVIVPLIGAEVNYFFLKNKRGTLSLSVFDLLNKNTGIQRISEMNYLRETQSNTIGRYVMLSFKYRLNKFEGNNGDINIKMAKH